MSKKSTSNKKRRVYIKGHGNKPLLMTIDKKRYKNKPLLTPAKKKNRR